MISDSRHGLFDRLNYRAMVTSITPIIQQYTPRAQVRVGDRSAYVTLEPDAYLDSTTSTTQLAKQTHASPHVPITNGTDSYHRNHQYSVTAVTTSTGAIAERYAYSAYGQPTVLDASASVLSSSAINNRYTYTGREWDSTLGLHHFRARWMSPSAGRFLGRDPIGFEGSEWGLYSYAKTNPTRYVDWNGKSPQDPVPPIDKPIPGGGANWDCTTKKAENRKQKSFPVILNTCCKGTLDVFIYAVRCFEPGWEDGGVNRVPPAPIPTDAELAQHFYTKVEVRFRLGRFTPAGCGEDKRWSSSSCNVYPGRFLSALTGDWVTWPPVGAPLEMIDFNESRFLGAACESTKNVPPGTTK